MGKSTHFLGQPLYGQVIKLLDKAEILEISRKNGGERYIKRFDAWTHLMTMLYAVIMRHDSLREISVSMLSEARKLAHLGVSMMPTRSTLSDANARRPEVIVNIYRQRWEIELLFKQIKQNFPLRYFYGESRNAIKIQIWVTLIANLLLMVIQSRLSRNWSFSGLTTMVRLTLMYYVDLYSLLNQPERDWQMLLEQPAKDPPMPSLFE